MAHQSHPRGRGEGESQALTAGGGTIAAVATPPGRGGIGIVRVSGGGARAIAQQILGSIPPPRHATFASFLAADGATIDQGIGLLFEAPNSYTGEDVLELQGHGGPVVMQRLLGRCVELGARLAEPGEFTRRAFLNERLDLAQAESVADLIDASSVEAARSAARSLEGEFSKRIHALVAALTELRIHVEACIDFPEEEIDAEDRAKQAQQLERIVADLDALLANAQQGVVLREGLTVVLVGRPNVGKSSLLNRLAGDDIAIVTPIAGTTRDYVRATITLEGVPIHLIDTAGLREATDEVERIGIARTWEAIEKSGATLFIEEAGAANRAAETQLLARLPRDVPQVRVINKIDLVEAVPVAASEPGTLRVSARTGEGVPAVKTWLLEAAGWKPQGEGVFMARGRHLAALEEALAYLREVPEHYQAIELMAENMRLAQQALGRITGKVSADELLGEIFSRFCIGK